MIEKLLAAQAVFRSFNVPDAGLGEWDVQRAVIGAGLLFPIIGAAFRFILRSSAGAITAVLALLWALDIIGLFPPVW